MSNDASFEVRDYLGHYGESEQLARKIKNYWLRLGHPWVQTWVESFWSKHPTPEDPKGKKTYVVRSNIIPTNPLTQAPDRERVKES